MEKSLNEENNVCSKQVLSERFLKCLKQWSTTFRFQGNMLFAKSSIFCLLSQEAAIVRMLIDKV